MTRSEFFEALKGVKTTDDISPERLAELQEEAPRLSLSISLDEKRDDRIWSNFDGRWHGKIRTLVKVYENGKLVDE